MTLGLWEMSYLDSLFLKGCTNTTRYFGHHPRPCLPTPHAEVGGLWPRRIQPPALAPIYVKECVMGNYHSLPKLGASATCTQSCPQQWKLAALVTRNKSLLWP